LKKFVRNTRSRRHLKNLNHDRKDVINLGNVGKAENVHSGREKAEDDLTETVVDHAEIGIGEENGVDRQG
jgi:hypothetical protein